MQQNYLLKVFLSFFLIAHTIAVQPQNSWAIATIKEGKTMPSIAEYHCESEKGKNGVDYFRIYDESFRIRKDYYNPVKLHYGYRIADEHIYIYDFELGEERLGFDFTLSTGDHFRTYNGIEWEVEATLDTLVNTSYLGKGESSSKRLLKVRSTDNRYSDQWLEDFGSFVNHFMILPMSETEQRQTLWMEYEEGRYLIREISSDPLFTHETEMPENTHENTEKDESVCCTYTEYGSLIVEDEQWHSPNREYTCYYRVGDDLYCLYVWELNPATDAAYVVWSKDVAYYTGLPVPQSGQYTIHFIKEDSPSGIVGLINASKSNQTKSPIYDLRGCQQILMHRGDVYIQDGRKRIVK